MDDQRRFTFVRLAAGRAVLRGVPAWMHRVVSVSDGDVVLRGIAVADGRAMGYGWHCPGACGGGIINLNSKLTLIDSMVANNTAGASGGGMYNNGASLTLINSAVANNTAGSVRHHPPPAHRLRHALLQLCAWRRGSRAFRRSVDSIACSARPRTAQIDRVCGDGF